MALSSTRRSLRRQAELALSLLCKVMHRSNKPFLHRAEHTSFTVIHNCLAYLQFTTWQVRELATWVQQRQSNSARRNDLETSEVVRIGPVGMGDR